MLPSTTVSRAQRGVVLLMALIMLVAMTLTGIALYRQIGTGLIIARNLSFRLSAAASADLGIESARLWLVPTDPVVLNTRKNELLLEQSVGGKLYYYPAWCYGPDAATRQVNGLPINCSTKQSTADFDPFTYDWSHSTLVTSDDGAGNEIRYVIHRLCALPGSMDTTETAGQRCPHAEAVTTGKGQGLAAYGASGIPNESVPYYRITARALDRTNTRVYTQAVMY
jgi:Tfp pilus assembly protein PilX